LGRDLRHLINVVHVLSTRSIGFKVLTGHGASIDTTTSAGKLVFGIFASPALGRFRSHPLFRGRQGGISCNSKHLPTILKLRYVYAV